MLRLLGQCLDFATGQSQLFEDVLRRFSVVGVAIVVFWSVGFGSHIFLLLAIKIASLPIGEV